MRKMAIALVLLTLSTVSFAEGIISTSNSNEASLKILAKEEKSCISKRGEVLATLEKGGKVVTYAGKCNLENGYWSSLVTIFKY